MKNILFFGDSLTAGYGLTNPDAESFPALIDKKIAAEGLPYRAINAGLSGDTSLGGSKRLRTWLHKPIDVFVLQLGINDLIRRISPDTTYENLETIVKTVRYQHPQAKLALMGMELPPNVPSPWVTEFNAIFKKLADAYHMAFVPFFLKDVAGKRNLNMHDGLHPSAEGYQVIATNVWPVLKPLLH